MRRNILILNAALAAFAALSSCQTNVVVESPLMEAPEVVASLETGIGSKSMISVDGEGVGTIYWTPSDDINVFYGTTSTKYTSRNTENALTAVFRTNDIIGSTESASDNIWGLYPYDDDAVCDGTTVTTTIPSTQYGVPDTFDDDLFTTLAHSETNALKFYNVCGGIKFSLSRNDITEITFRGNNSEDLAGSVSLTFTNNLPAASVLSGEKVITLLPKTGGTFAQNTNYYLVLLPATLSAGFTMTFLTSDGSTGTFNYTTSAVTIKRSVFSRKANIDKYATFVPVVNIQFEDANFKAYCVENFDTNSDGEISTAEAAVVTTIQCNSRSISSLSGIEYFTALTYLNCRSNQLTSLNVSNNTALTYLNCTWNQLTSLDVNDCTALTELQCEENQLTTLDVSKHTALTTLYCFDNQLASLDISGCTALTTLILTAFNGSPNPLTSIDVSGCTALTSLDCASSQLASLDVRSCTALIYLKCSGNQLTSLDVSNNTALTTLNCSANQLSTLDVSACTALEFFYCETNQLTSLDVSGCTALTTLDCYNNRLTSLDVSNNAALTDLRCGTNQLTSLDVSNNTRLDFLYCGDNRLASLDVSNNTALTDLRCNWNQLTSLNVSNNTALTTLNCYVNQITSLDVSSCTALRYLDCLMNQLTSLDVSNNLELVELDCRDNPNLSAIWLKTGQTIATLKRGSGTIYYK